MFSCSYPHCSGHGKCSSINGSCLCEDIWSGPYCNISLEEELNNLINKPSSISITMTTVLKTGTLPTTTVSHDTPTPLHVGSYDTTIGSHEPSDVCAVSPTLTFGLSIGIAIVTVCIHVVLFVWTHKSWLKSFYERVKMKTTPKNKRRRKRRKRYFVPLVQETSSDCNI